AQKVLVCATFFLVENHCVTSSPAAIVKKALDMH
ncbi:hypothetical protein QFZ20_000001, partial [Flavobacterium sp. W4I14]|nr:hypothetical protein [Flavobacterium sp. W4I14]